MVIVTAGFLFIFRIRFMIKFKMNKDYIKLHLIVFVLGFTAILGNLISVSPISVVFFRTLIASVSLFLFLKYKKVSIKLPYTDVKMLLFVGFLLGIHWLCFFGSARLSTVSVSLVCFSTTSFFTSVLEPLIKKTRVNYTDLLLGLIAIVGVGLIFKFETDYKAAILIGVLGAFLAALFSVYNSNLTTKFSSSVIGFYELGGAFLTIFVSLPFFVGFSVVTNVDFMIKSNDLLWILILSLVCTVYPYTQMISLLRKIPVFTVNLSLNMEPIYGIVMAYLIFGEKEKMSPEFYFGAFLVIGSIFIQPFFKQKNLSISEEV